MSERFWSKVAKSDGCWEWTGAKDSGGYGCFGVKIESGKYRTTLAHRVSWELTHGPVPSGPGYHGVCVLHRCDNRTCVNPNHLFLGSNHDNAQDRSAKGRSASLKGLSNPRAAESAVKVEIALKALSDGATQRRAASLSGLNKMTVNRLANGNHWATRGE